VPEQLVVRRWEGAEHQRATRRVDAERVAEGGHHERLVEGDPERDAIGEPRRHDARELREPVCGVPG